MEDIGVFFIPILTKFEADKRWIILQLAFVENLIIICKLICEKINKL